MLHSARAALHCALLALHSVRAALHLTLFALQSAIVALHRALLALGLVHVQQRVDCIGQVYRYLKLGLQFVRLTSIE